MPKRAISPSLLSADFSRLAEQISIVEGAGVDRLHLDIMDGVYVPNITFGPFIVKAIRKSSTSHLDVHLMIDRPHRYFEQFVKAGADTLIVHYEGSEDISRDLATIRSLGAEAGVAINPDTPFSALEPFLGEFDYVLVMSVVPGFGGQGFIDGALDNMTAAVDLRKAEEYMVAVDGGVNLDTVDKVFATGIDLAIVGSGLFKADDIPARLAALNG